MRTLVILAVVLGIAVIAVVHAMRIWNRIVFTFSFRGVDLSQFSFESLTSFGSTSANLILSLNIRNNNSFSIPVKDMKVVMYYNGTVVAETSNELAEKKFEIPANGSKDITDKVNVHLNSASIRLLKEAIAKKSPKVNYTVKVKVFGIGLTYSDYFPFQA